MLKSEDVIKIKTLAVLCLFKLVFSAHIHLTLPHFSLDNCLSLLCNWNAHILVGTYIAEAAISSLDNV